MAPGIRDVEAYEATSRPRRLAHLHDRHRAPVGPTILALALSQFIPHKRKDD